MNAALARLLSLVWPVRVRRVRGRHGDLEVVWESGRSVVNSAHANQSHGSLHRVWRQAFREVRVDQRRPDSVLILGFGAGSAASLLLNEHGLRSVITGVDDDPAMLGIAREFFLPSIQGHVELVQADAGAFIRSSTDRYDLVLVDLFEDLDFADIVSEPSFLQSVRSVMAPNGMVLLNVVEHDERSRTRSARLGHDLRLLFTDVEEHRYERSNRVYVAL